MKTFWLNKKNNERLILFFNGWGMDQNPISNLNIDGFDILVVYDYSDFSLDVDSSAYSEIILIAWSMGVFAASLACKGLKISKAIAINGTQSPIDAKFGINPKIYQLTLDNFSEKTRDNFFQNMFLDENEYKKFQKPLRNLENQHEELAFLQKAAKENSALDFNFDYAIISAHDKIIPSKNQERFWQTKKVKVVKLSSGHYPFFEFKNFEEILNETL